MTDLTDESLVVNCIPVVEHSTYHLQHQNHEDPVDEVVQLPDGEDVQQSQSGDVEEEEKERHWLPLLDRH